MNSLNKKILLGIVIIVLLIIAGGMGAIFYWQKAHISLDISPEAVKVKCLEDVSKMTDEELINEVKNLKYPDEIMPSTDEERMTYATKQMINYLICKSANSNDEQLNIARTFIETLKIPKESKQKFLSLLDEAYSSSTVWPYDALALNPIETICSNNEMKPEFLELFFKDLSPTEEEIRRSSKICKIIDKYKDNTSSFIEDEIVGDWSDDKYFIPRQMRTRVAIAFRLGGKELAIKICNYVPYSEEVKQEECEMFSNLLNYLNDHRTSNCIETGDYEIYQECVKFHKEVIELICPVDQN